MHEKDDQLADKMSQELVQGFDRSTADPEGQVPFVAVPVTRFVLMSLATFGLYELWWFYKNWQRVKQRTGSDIYPFWRAVFSPIYCYQFVQTIRQTSDKVGVATSLSAGGITVAYIAFLVTNRAPDPWWWIAVLAFLALIPAVVHIDRLHQTVYPGFARYAPFGKGHVAALLIFVPFTAFAFLGTFMTPPTKALRTAEIPHEYVDTLVGHGLIEPGEKVLYFYSGGIFSIEEDGNLLTDSRVVSYEESDGEIWSQSAQYAAISDVEVQWSQGVFEDTVVTVGTADERIFDLIVSSEEGRDREFVNKLESLRNVSVAAE